MDVASDQVQMTGFVYVGHRGLQQQVFKTT